TPPPAEEPSAQQGGPLSALMPRMPMRRPGARRNGAQLIGRAYLLENGKPAPVLFRPGVSDGRFTQVLDLDPQSVSAELAGPMAGTEELERALKRKLEPGVKVIVDAQAAKP